MKSILYFLTTLLILTVLIGCETSTAPTAGNFSTEKGVNNTDASPYPGELYSISGVVFRDDNENGVRDDGEPGIPGVAVTLGDANTHYTDDTGFYIFRCLPEGTYRVTADDVEDMRPTTPQTRTVEIIDRDVEDVDFGFVPEEEVYYTISGTVFFDVDGDGLLDDDEPGIPGVEVTLNDETVTYTDEDGFYIFTGLRPGDYTVECEDIDGLTPTTPIYVEVTIVDEDVVVDFGFELDFEEYCGGTANGATIGFWKNNIRKAILQGRRNGFQIPAETLEEYIEQISEFALAPFSGLTAQAAYNVLNSHSNDPVDLLQKQLLASEFNFMNEAYINDDMMMTWFFLYYGEYLVVHADEYTRDELLYAKDWYDAYNNSHGGEFYGPGCDD